MGKPYFKYKQFTIWHDQCAMKVNTDSHVLGALCDVKQATKILDIGTGSGVLALFLAQKSEAEIVAIEIESNAAQQASDNFAKSPWKDRLHCKNISLQNFTNELMREFDLIISNPPYFIDSLKNPDSSKELARHTKSLSLAELAENSEKLITPSGEIWIIFPMDNSEKLINEFAKKGLLLIKLWNIHLEYNEVIPKRGVFIFSKLKSDLKTENLHVYNKDRSYTTQCTELLKPFHLYL